MWEPKDAKEALAYALLVGFGLDIPVNTEVDLDLQEAVDRMSAKADEILSSLKDEGYEIARVVTG